jgi:hypothetical protein
MTAENPYYSISGLLSGIVFNEVPYIKNISSTLSIESSISINISKTVFASQSLSGELSLTASAVPVRFAEATLDGIANVSVISPVSVVAIDSLNFSISSNLLLSDLIRFTPNNRYPGSYVTLLLLDGVPLTDQNRKFNNNIKPTFVEKVNWNSTKNRYYKRATSEKQSFKISWEWLPADRDRTIDKREARNYVKNKAMDPDVHTLTVITYGENPEDVFDETEYNVFITNYAEDLIRRDLSSGVYLWKCDVDLEEL